MASHLQNGTNGDHKKHFEIAIVGGGIAGLTLAIALHRRSIPFAIYEQAPAFGEIGAGVSFSPNAVQAMMECHPGVYDAFERVCTRNLWPSKRKVWFDYVNGYGETPEHKVTQETAFTISNDLGQNGVHRAHFLAELVKLVPDEVAHFGKKLQGITEQPDGRLQLSFDDGTSAEADAVIGCDGIKSRVRQSILGPDHPALVPSYTYKYAYRGLVPMEEAIKAIGEERAENACMHMGQDAHILTFPVNRGQILNIVAFRTTSEPWSDTTRLTKPARREELLEDFKGFNPTSLRLLELTKLELDIWAIFDLGENPVPTFHKGRVCISGDAAHATSPHHGAGAGFCIEDSAMMAELLAHEQVTSREHLEAVFATFDAERRERTQWLVQSSRRLGNCYEWRADGVGADFGKIEAEINERNGIIANIDMAKMCADAKQRLSTRLA
ncbi:hypothetical protein LTR37_013977 [Vermiconidia calcicola]|uniref:Uncharacterized protein n=1 Tax=Vermiconidia calcicola TaxID=1690605 RepID=A0ACC3MUR2_9PEZI|nr:hypothetical protein LTR37_013977 [Vermiconidia calcicola]